MTRDALLVEIAVARKVFDDKVASVPYELLRDEVPGFGFSVAQLVGHVAQYDRLIVDRLESAGHGAMTELPADRDPERYEITTWTFADGWSLDEIMRRADASYHALVRRLRSMTDDELSGGIGSGGALDGAWLKGRPPWRAILDDSAAHYREHEPALDAALSVCV